MIVLKIVQVPSVTLRITSNPMLATDYNQSHLKHLPKIVIRTVPHNEQKYETCGNWFYNEAGELVIEVSETNTMYEFLIAVHELVEAMLCNFKGISEESVTDFDKSFEHMRNLFPIIVGDKEPGDEDAAPYLHEHRMASRIENWLADSAGVDKEDYNNTINSLSQN